MEGLQGFEVRGLGKKVERKGRHGARVYADQSASPLRNEGGLSLGMRQQVRKAGLLQ